MNITKEEKVKLIMDRITEDATNGGSPNSPTYKIISPKKLAEFLEEHISKVGE